MNFETPPHSDIVFYPDVQQRIGLELTGLLCHLIANAKPAGQGAWAHSTKILNFAKDTGISKDKLSRMLKTLHAAGLITTVKGNPHGPNGGSDSHTYYLTYHPALGRPTEPPPKSRHPHLREPEKRDIGNRHLVTVIPHENVVEIPKTAKTAKTANQTLSVMSLTVKENQQQTNITTPIPKNVEIAFASIGWENRIPIPQHYPWEVLLAVIAYAKREGSIERKAAFVASKLKSEKTLFDFARDKSLLGSDGKGTLGSPLPAPARMDDVEYDRLAEENPDWKHQVETEARRLARMNNDNYIRPTFLWQAVSLIGIPDKKAKVN